MSSFDLDGRNAVIQNAKGRLEGDLSTPGLGRAVALYFDPAENFAGRTFDSLGGNPRNQITSDDLLAVTLLDIRWTPLAVRGLLHGQGARVAELLGEIDSETDLWAEQGGEQLRAVAPLWKLLSDLPGVGDTTASKLLARKRPRLVPITDSIVVSAVRNRGRTWPTLRCCFRSDSFRQCVELLRPPQTEEASLLRIFDVAIWMLYSRSRAAREVRERARVPGSRAPGDVR